MMDNREITTNANEPIGDEGSGDGGWGDKG